RGSPGARVGGEQAPGALARDGSDAQWGPATRALRGIHDVRLRPPQSPASTTWVRHARALASGADGAKEVLDLFVHLFRRTDRPPDVLAQQLAVAGPEPVDRHARRAFAQPHLRPRLPIPGAGPARQERLEHLEVALLAVAGALVPQVLHRQLEQPQRP